MYSIKVRPSAIKETQAVSAYNITTSMRVSF